MKKNTRASGNRFQDRCAKLLTERAWSVHNQKTVSRAIQIKGKLIWTSPRNDIFGCFDLLAVKPGQKVLGVQCTLDEHVTKRVDEMGKTHWPHDHITTEIWIGRPDHTISVKRVFLGVAFDIGRFKRGGIWESQDKVQEEEY